MGTSLFLGAMYAGIPHLAGLRRHGPRFPRLPKITLVMRHFIQRGVVSTSDADWLLAPEANDLLEEATCAGRMRDCRSQNDV